MTEVAPETEEIEDTAAFSVHDCGDGIQRICDQDGAIIAETTDPRVAQVICRLMNENGELLFG